ncbi:MAG: hypothetical protein R3275_03770 [Saprospiraceae bacterium]|nr:hypothetical protein [Saprospiraceae bacterium]
MKEDLSGLFPIDKEKDDYTETDMVEQIRKRVAELLDKNPELLFSYLYRLDVEEHKIKTALKMGGPADEILADLIWQRQKQRLATRKAYRDDQKADD